MAPVVATAHPPVGWTDPPASLWSVVLSRRPHDRVTARAPAKINLHLSVGHPRPDGFHEITTVFQAVGLYDEVTVTRADQRSLTCDGPSGVPLDDTNLAARAIVLLAERTDNDPSLVVHISKGIPVAGGCAGGSADAAAALVAADALWACGLGKDDLAALGAELGSDVPFSLHGGTALGRGRGEQLTPVLEHSSFAWVLAIAAGGLSTPAVYAELDRQRDSGPVGLVSDPAQTLAALRSGDPVALGRALANDLQPAALALRPELRQVLDAGRELGALGALVSGSGPTVALLARDEPAAAGLTAALKTRNVCADVRRADGPVAGARVVEAR